MLFLIICILCVAKADLLSDRIANAKAWIIRSTNATTMNYAYSANVTSDSVAHIIRDVGDFGPPKAVALEYDNVVIDLAEFLDYNPFILKPRWDPSTITWIDANTLKVGWMLNYTTSYNVTTKVYNINADGFRYTEIIVFEPNSKLIKLGLTIQDPAAIAMLAQTYADVPVEYICSGIIFPACNGTNASFPRPYLVNTGFSTVAECVTFLSGLPPTKCPFAQRSNTPGCRTLHGYSAFKIPELHCAHTRPVSELCTDSCTAQCSNCHADAECVANFPTYFTPVYSCQCKNGYSGNGSTCTKQACPYGNCPALWGSYSCVGDLCTCKSSFTHNPNPTSNNMCQCPDGGKIVYQDGAPVCVPVGRCIAGQWECDVQSYNQVKCASYGPNTFTQFKHCQCNFGFEGGWEYPCSCPTGKRVVWSDTFNGEVCLSTNECTTNWHCSYPQTCVKPTGAQVGTCSV